MPDPVKIEKEYGVMPLNDHTPESDHYIKRREAKPDGRYIIYYTFGDLARKSECSPPEKAASEERADV